jgi:hypothetical protein
MNRIVVVNDVLVSISPKAFRAMLEAKVAGTTPVVVEKTVIGAINHNLDTMSVEAATALLASLTPAPTPTVAAPVAETPVATVAA